MGGGGFDGGDSPGGGGYPGENLTGGVFRGGGGNSPSTKTYNETTS